MWRSCCRSPCVTSHCASRGRRQGADADGLGVRGGLGLLGARLPKCDPRARESVHAGERSGEARQFHNPSRTEAGGGPGQNHSTLKNYGFVISHLMASLAGGKYPVVHVGGGRGCRWHSGAGWSCWMHWCCCEWYCRLHWCCCAWRCWTQSRKSVGLLVALELLRVALLVPIVVVTMGLLSVRALPRMLLC